MLRKPSKSALACASHSPLLHCFERPPEQWDAIQAGFAAGREFIDGFDPELVFLFGSDHFNGFFLQLMPAFCIGLEAQAEEDIGGFAGELSVPRQVALDSIEHLRASGFDPACSYRMRVDHAFSQTLNNLVGGLQAAPTVPIFINCICEPYVPFQRTRRFGEALGRHAAGLGRRVLFLASGGLSHHPRRYYPAFGDGGAELTAWQLSGGRSELSLSREQWLKRLRDMHIEGAKMIVRGERTAQDMRLNEASDRRFLNLLTRGQLEAFDAWDQQALVKEAGIGAMELQTWIAAAAAHLACGGRPPRLAHYSLAPELGIACGIAYG